MLLCAEMLSSLHHSFMGMR